MKNKKIFLIGFVSISVCLAMIAVYINYNNKTKEKDEFYSEFINKNNENIKESLGDYEVIGRVDESEKSPELFNLKYYNNQTKEHESFTLANTDKITVKEQINEYVTYLAKEDLSKKMDTETFGSMELVLGPIIDPEQSSIKLNEFTLENAENAGVKYKGIIIFFLKPEADFEKIKKDYEDELKYICKTYGQKDTFIELTVFDKTYTVTLQGDNLNFEFKPDTEPAG